MRAAPAAPGRTRLTRVAADRLPVAGFTFLTFPLNRMDTISRVRVSNLPAYPEGECRAAVPRAARRRA